MAELQIRAADLLYRTRGRDWDYAFLLQPEPLLGEGWYTLHRRIFANVEPSTAPLLRRGVLGVGAGQPFFATAFVAAESRDSQGRPVAHYIAWLGQAADRAPGWSFGPGLVAALQPALQQVFDLVPAALTRDESKPLDKLLRERFQVALPQTELNVSCTVESPIEWLGTISV